MLFCSENGILLDFELNRLILCCRRLLKTICLAAEAEGTEFEEELAELQTELLLKDAEPVGVPCNDRCLQMPHHLVYVCCILLFVIPQHKPKKHHHLTSTTVPR